MRPQSRSAPNGMVIQGDDDIYFPQLSINTNLFRLTSEPLLEDVVVNLKLDQNPRFSEPSQKSLLEAVKTIFNRATFNGPETQPPPRSEASPTGPDDKPELAGGTRPTRPLRLHACGWIDGRTGQRVPRTLKVTFTHTDPAITQAVANGVAQDFINQTYENKTERFTSASKWLDTTTRELKAKVEAADQQLANYTKTHNIFSTEGKESLTTDNLTRLHDQAMRVETERILKQSVYEEVKAGRLSELPAAFLDPKITFLLNQARGFGSQPREAQPEVRAGA